MTQQPQTPALTPNPTINSLLGGIDPSQASPFIQKYNDYYNSAGSSAFNTGYYPGSLPAAPLHPEDSSFEGLFKAHMELNTILGQITPGEDYSQYLPGSINPVPASDFNATDYLLSGDNYKRISQDPAGSYVISRGMNGAYRGMDVNQFLSAAAYDSAKYHYRQRIGQASLGSNLMAGLIASGPEIVATSMIPVFGEGGLARIAMGAGKPIAAGEIAAPAARAAQGALSIGGSSPMALAKSTLGIFKPAMGAAAEGATQMAIYGTAREGIYQSLNNDRSSYESAGRIASDMITGGMFGIAAKVIGSVTGRIPRVEEAANIKTTIDNMIGPDFPPPAGKALPEPSGPKLPSEPLVGEIIGPDLSRTVANKAKRGVDTYTRLPKGLSKEEASHFAGRNLSDVEFESGMFLNLPRGEKLVPDHVFPPEVQGTISGPDIKTAQDISMPQDSGVITVDKDAWRILVDTDLKSNTYRVMPKKPGGETGTEVSEPKSPSGPEGPIDIGPTTFRKTGDLYSVIDMKIKAGEKLTNDLPESELASLDSKMHEVLYREVEQQKARITDSYRQELITTVNQGKSLAAENPEIANVITYVSEELKNGKQFDIAWRDQLTDAIDMGVAKTPEQQAFLENLVSEIDRAANKATRQYGDLYVRYNDLARTQVMGADMLAIRRTELAGKPLEELYPDLPPRLAEQIHNTEINFEDVYHYRKMQAEEAEAAKIAQESELARAKYNLEHLDELEIIPTNDTTPILESVTPEGWSNVTPEISSRLNEIAPQGVYRIGDDGIYIQEPDGQGGWNPQYILPIEKFPELARDIRSGEQLKSLMDDVNRNLELEAAKAREKELFTDLNKEPEPVAAKKETLRPEIVPDKINVDIITTMVEDALRTMDIEIVHTPGSITANPKTEIILSRSNKIVPVEPKSLTSGGGKPPTEPPNVTMATPSPEERPITAKDMREFMPVLRKEIGKAAFAAELRSTLTLGAIFSPELRGLMFKTVGLISPSLMFKTYTQEKKDKQPVAVQVASDFAFWSRVLEKLSDSPDKQELVKHLEVIKARKSGDINTLNSFNNGVIRLLASDITKNPQYHENNGKIVAYLGMDRQAQAIANSLVSAMLPITKMAELIAITYHDSQTAPAISHISNILNKIQGEVFPDRSLSYNVRYLYNKVDGQLAGNERALWHDIFTKYFSPLGRVDERFVDGMNDQGAGETGHMILDHAIGSLVSAFEGKDISKDQVIRHVNESIVADIGAIAAGKERPSYQSFETKRDFTTLALKDFAAKNLTNSYENLPLIKRMIVLNNTNRAIAVQKAIDTVYGAK